MRALLVADGAARADADVWVAEIPDGLKNLRTTHSREDLS
ncbi:hypothetical protein Tpau_3549 [Tsukamurella paurometabola DSM 20162]|uniref:Uncharacterized protein n=1 Tax=Tsukamurella paurometabola (strain ATCC 8368 / DSM 20162 / CCUG 35730 / CIP 100753 / JCM 10117 / KCTC 9821 / NBRC 16120 / NCIMB 702349 / NCTC 13040) TaxID=521096 RepID=D5UXA9_TSUPD|nr:hypothetical protein Tpau_3549 [Tsukamurella paurometabola DSM 20162]